MPFIKENVKVGDILSINKFKYRINRIIKITQSHLIADYTELNTNSNVTYGYFDQSFSHKPMSKESKEKVLLNKIKYLYERNPLDKPRTVPPKGIYRGSNPVPQASEPSQARASGDEVSVHATRQTRSFQSVVNYLAELQRTNPELFSGRYGFLYSSSDGLTGYRSNDYIINTTDNA